MTGGGLINWAGVPMGRASQGDGYALILRPGSQLHICGLRIDCTVMSFIVQVVLQENCRLRIVLAGGVIGG